MRWHDDHANLRPYWIRVSFHLTIEAASSVRKDAIRELDKCLNSGFEILNKESRGYWTGDCTIYTLWKKDEPGEVAR